MSETPTLPAIPEAAIEALVADLVQECERAIKQHEAALLDPSKRGGYIQTHDTMFGFIVRKHLAALPHLSIPSAPAPIQGDAAGAAATARAELVRQALIKAKLTSHDDTFVQASTREIVNAIGALTAADARVAELEREAMEALKPFSVIADGTDFLGDGQSVSVNVNRCRDARAILSKLTEATKPPQGPTAGVRDEH